MNTTADMQERLLELQATVEEAEFLRTALYLESEGFVRFEERDGEIMVIPL